MIHIIKQKGFTLIEILIVLAIVGLMSSIVVTTTTTVREKARIAKTASNMSTLAKAVELSYDQYGTFPCLVSSVPGTWDDSPEATAFQSSINWPRKNEWGGVYLWSGASIAGQPYGILTNNIPLESAVALDVQIDDGSLSTGRVRSISGTVIVNIVLGMPTGMLSTAGGCPPRLGHILPP